MSFTSVTSLRRAIEIFDRSKISPVGRTSGQRSIIPKVQIVPVLSICKLKKILI
ncbi:hypothetical protein THIOM_003033 [Candidatus Thiomargarita nelsonii]|uniref:Uncharacterized protein n=1 Tax=Candidatus Thiomargarita nelsonii TaxID=1003181 RepID=A0A176RZU2_9GAMM|nr:hypothetical protein THIOM_003033 [Candidatus Thiomargarita nelsonii]